MIGLLVEHRGRKIALPLIDVVRLPILGTQYKLLGAEDVSKMLNDSVESLVEIHEAWAFRPHPPHGADYRRQPPGSPQDDPQAYSNFQSGTDRAEARVTLAQTPIPEGIACLLVVNPREKFTDYELYQIDQFLMQGKSLALFVEAFEEAMVSPNQPPVYQPLETGLERLLEHYGVRVRRAYVMDGSATASRCRPDGRRRAAGLLRTVDQTPVHEPGVAVAAESIKGLVVVEASPIELAPEESRPKTATAHLLLASSEKSWEIKDRINLDPMSLRPPTSAADLRSRHLAYLLEGRVFELFCGQTHPGQGGGAEKGAAGGAGRGVPRDRPVQGRTAGANCIAQGKPGKIFVLASATCSKTWSSTRPAGCQHRLRPRRHRLLNQRGNIAVMRAKEQTFNPLTRPAPRPAHVHQVLHRRAAAAGGALRNRRVGPPGSCRRNASRRCSLPHHSDGYARKKQVMARCAAPSAMKLPLWKWLPATIITARLPTPTRKKQTSSEVDLPDDFVKSSNFEGWKP